MWWRVKKISNPNNHLPPRVSPSPIISSAHSVIRLHLIQKVVKKVSLRREILKKFKLTYCFDNSQLRRSSIQRFYGICQMKNGICLVIDFLYNSIRKNYLVEVGSRWCGWESTEKPKKKWP